MEKADFQAAHIGANQVFWARLRALADSDVMVGAHLKNSLGKFAAELAYTWRADWKEKSKAGLFDQPLHLRVAQNIKLGKGLTYDQVAVFGKECKSRDRMDYQVTPSTKVSFVAETDLKEWSSPSTAVKHTGVNVEIKL